MSTLTTFEKILAVATPSVMQIAGSALAYRMRNVDLLKKYYLARLGCAATILGLTTQTLIEYIFPIWVKALPPVFTDINKSQWWLIIQTITFLNVTKSAIHFIGGNKFYKKHGINSYWKALVSAILPCQVYFNTNNNKQIKYKNNIKYLLVKASEISVISIFGRLISKYLNNNQSIMNYIENDANILIKMEILSFCISCELMLSNIPSIILGLLIECICSVFGINNDNMRIVLPYNFTYFNTSPREFWNNWSKPTGEWLRYFLYEPFGGRDKLYFSVPAVFGYNCFGHIRFGQIIHHVSDHSNMFIKSWSGAFVSMGSAVMIQIGMEKYFKSNSQNSDDDDKKKLNKRWLTWDKVFLFNLFHLSMAAAMYSLHKGAWPCNMYNLSNTFLML